MTDKRFIENSVEEYEKLKQECEALQMSDNEAREIVAELKAECEALRDEKAYANMACEQFEKQIDEYSQTLTEIKEIAEVDFNHTCWKTYAKQLKQILQKIDEVLNDR